MTEGLADERVRAVRADSPRVQAWEIPALAARIPEWRIVERHDVLRLERVFLTPDFRSALAFAALVGEMAEAENHHPAILTEWGRVTVRWWTLRLRGLHRNDFVMAAKTDRLWEEWDWEGG